MITHRLERLLSKRRILELYLNVVEWGGGTWGAEAASRRYFRKSASGLGASEAALLAGALINPNRYSPADPPPRLRRRQQMILRRMGTRDAPVPPSEHEPAKAVSAPAADTSVGTLPHRHHRPIVVRKAARRAHRSRHHLNQRQHRMRRQRDRHRHHLPILDPMWLSGVS